ncbi:MAG: hypothetical protein ACOY4I_12115 [Bacillota bacterium]
MNCETDFSGKKGVLPPSDEWRAVHRGIIQRPFEIEITLPGGAVTKDYSGHIETRWVQAGEYWELQFYNKVSQSLSFFLKWYIPASERLCCYSYGRYE